MSINTETDLRWVKERLLESFPKNKVEDINITRVEDYITRVGLTLKPYIIFSKEDLPIIQEIDKDTQVTRSEVFITNMGGMYIHEIDLALLERNPDYQEANGPIFTEGFLVHELAHASNMYKGQGWIYKKVRTGFELMQADKLILRDIPKNVDWNDPVFWKKIKKLYYDGHKPWGRFLEEGFAEMIRANYVAEYATEEWKGKIKQYLKLDNLTMSDTIPLKTLKGDYLPLPFKYFLFTPEATVRHVGDHSFAGYGLELLCQKAPGLEDQLKAGRSDVNALREIAKIINGIYPGLYPFLQHLEDLFTADFSQDRKDEKEKCEDKLRYIILKVYGGDIHQVIKSEGLLREVWKKRLQQQS